MKIHGVTGSIASGKSAVAGMFERLGAVRIDADAAGHESLTLPSVVAALRERWGDSIFAQKGAVDRAAVARIVFAPTELGKRELAFLESITHPRIAEIMVRQSEDAKKFGAKIAVVDAPLLYESGWDALTQGVVFVDCPFEIRLERALERGWSEAEFLDRSSRQLSPDEKRRRARWTVSTWPQTPEQTAEQVAALWREWIDTD